MVVGLGRAMVSQLDCQPGTSGRGLVTHTAQSCRRRTRILQQRVVARSAAPAKGRCASLLGHALPCPGDAA